MISFLNVYFKRPLILVRISMKAREGREMKIVFLAMA